MKRRVETKTLTREVWIVRRLAGVEPARLLGRCGACGGPAWMLPPEEAARLHFTEAPDGSVLICLNSLPTNQQGEGS